MSKRAFTSQTTEKASVDQWVFASMPDKRDKKNSGRMFTVVLFAFIILFLLAMLLVGTQVYKTVNNSQAASDDARLSLSLLAGNVRANDTIDAIGESEGPEGPALVLREDLESGSYETRIYTYQGKIMEEYSAADNEYAPEKAREIVVSSRFEFEYVNGLLTIYTDYGSVDVALRCAKEVS